MATLDIATVDITAIAPIDSFVLDTNILFFIHSGFYTTTSKNWTQITAYTNFISKLLLRGNKLYITTAAIQEFLFGLEKKLINCTYPLMAIVQIQKIVTFFQDRL